MDRFILGGILMGIILMALYGTGASDDFPSWFDDSESTRTQSDFNPSNSGAPLEQAGDLPRRQIPTSTGDFNPGDPNASDNGDNTTEDTPNNNPEPQPPPVQDPVRALW